MSWKERLREVIEKLAPRNKKPHVVPKRETTDSRHDLERRYRRVFTWRELAARCPNSFVMLLRFQHKTYPEDVAGAVIKVSHDKAKVLSAVDRLVRRRILSFKLMMGIWYTADKPGEVVWSTPRDLFSPR
ncbi:MAG: hypothetical protein HY459_01415 [Parcubacteria group bacterium]|nr:hypothetical protein [Parcubacteria group bacterium]